MAFFGPPIAVILNVLPRWFWSVVQPANVEMMRWPLDAIPQDWANWRNRWEYGHAVCAGLVTIALAALTWSVLGRC
jgi:hypothetical protein